MLLFDKRTEIKLKIDCCNEILCEDYIHSLVDDSILVVSSIHLLLTSSIHLIWAWSHVHLWVILHSDILSLIWESATNTACIIWAIWISTTSTSNTWSTWSSCCSLILCRVEWFIANHVAPIDCPKETEKKIWCCQ